MKPKEKAKELLVKFARGGWRKEHAISCVEEIIKEYNEEILLSNDINSIMVFYFNRINYWEEVKAEIETLS